MPYKLRKAPKRDLYWVINKDTKEKHSKEPLPLDRAKAQMKALYASEKSSVEATRSNPLRKGGSSEEMNTLFNELLDTLKDDLYEGKGKGKDAKEYAMGEIRRIYKERTKTDMPVEKAEQYGREFSTRLEREAPKSWGMRKEADITNLKRRFISDFLDREGFTSGATLSPKQQEKYTLDKERESKALEKGKTLIYLDKYPLFKEKVHISRVDVNPTEKDRIERELAIREAQLKLAKDDLKRIFTDKSLTDEQRTEIRKENVSKVNKIVRNPIEGLEQLYEDLAYVSGTLASLEGEGLFDDAIALGKKAYQRVKDVSKGIRKGYSPSARKMLEKYGVWNVVGLAVRRDPIQSAIHTAFNVLTLGMWEKALKEVKYDKLFHLGLLVELESRGQRKKLLVEKNEVINIQDPKPTQSKTEIIVIPPPRPIPTLNHFLYKAEKQRGEAYFLYDPFENNCQDYILSLLNANDALTPYARSFIKQDVSSLVDKLPGYIKPVAKAITDLGGMANVALEGGTRREDFFKAHNLSPSLKPSLKELSKISGVPLKTLQEVYNRGIGAYKTQPQSVRLKGSYMKNVDAPMEKKLSKEQWAWARVYSFLTGNPKHDNDLRANKKKKTLKGGVLDKYIGGAYEFDDLVKDSVVIAKEIGKYALGLTPEQKFVADALLEMSLGVPSALSRVKAHWDAGRIQPILKSIWGVVSRLHQGRGKKKSLVRTPRSNPLPEGRLSRVGTIKGGAVVPEQYSFNEWTDMVYKRPMGGEIIRGITIPALAEYINSLPTPHQVRDILMTLYNNRPKTGLGKDTDVDEYYAKRIKEYEDWWAESTDVLKHMEGVLHETYKEAFEVFNQVRGGNMGALDKAFQIAEIVADGFDTLRKLTTPQGLFETGINTLTSMISTITSPDFNKPVPPSSYSYREELSESLGNMAGDLGRVAGQVVGALGEAFGAKSNAQQNDAYVEAVLKRKYEDSINVVRMFQKAGDYDLYRIKLLNDTQKQNVISNRAEGELKHQYEKDIFFINRMTDDQYANRFGEMPPKDRVYISFEDWKAGKRMPKVQQKAPQLDSKGRPCGVYEVCKPLAGSGKILSAFESQLKEAGLSPEEYLKQVRANAKKNGYDPSKITFSDKPEKKLQITNEKGQIRRFGRVGLGDYFIWKALEKIGKAPKGKAEQKRNTFHISHSKIRGNWKSDKYSPNNLALKINW